MRSGRISDRLRADLWKWLRDGDTFGRDYAKIFGIVIDDHDAPPTVYRSQGGPAVEVHAVRPALRRTVDGSVRTDLVIEITQRRRGYFDPQEQRKRDDRADPLSQQLETADFTFRAGCTVLINPRSAEILRVIRTRGTIANDEELARVRRFLVGETGIVGNAFDAGLAESRRKIGKTVRNEPFALLHQLLET